MILEKVRSLRKTALASNSKPWLKSGEHNTFGVFLLSSLCD